MGILVLLLFLFIGALVVVAIAADKTGGMDDFPFD